MKKFKKNKVLYILAAILFVLILVSAIEFAAFSQIKSINENQLKNSAFFVGTVNENVTAKIQPTLLSPKKFKIEKNEKIKIIAKNGKWCKIVVNDGKRLKKGYAKASDFSDISQGIVEMSAIEIFNKSISGMPGDKATINMSIYPVYSNEKIDWISDDETVAYVDNGAIVLNKSGCVKITAKTSNCEESIEVTVFEPDETIKFNTDKIVVDCDKNFEITKYLRIKENNKIEYYVSNPDIAKIENGKFIPKSAGKTVLIASTGKNTAKCTVEVRSVSGHSSAPLNMVNIYGNTYDFHPSALAFENGFGGFKFWIAFTPYENSNDFFENPHILASNDLVNWQEPNGFKNPLEPVPDRYKAYTTYNSDTELVYNSDTKQIECWWRFYDSANQDVILFRKTTSDGVNWGDKEQLFISPDMKFDFLSPSVIYEDGIYKMWSINQHSDYALEYRESKNAKNWSEPRKIKFEYENKDFYNWHMDIIHTPKGYEICMSGSDKNVRGHNDMPVFYSYSPDNINYTKARPMLNPQKGTNEWDNRGHYRSCMIYFDKKYYLFYSGINESKGAMGVGMISGTNPFNMK